MLIYAILCVFCSLEQDFSLNRDKMYYLFMIKMKNNKFHTVGTIIKSFVLKSFKS